jgi:desulfoferrodoxin (superoxide reductase-like protein)
MSMLIAAFAACGQAQQQSTENERLKNQVYFTQDDPGRWKDFKDDHDPKVKVAGGTVAVDVPLTAEIGHYVEVILLMDAHQREIASKSFRRGEKPHAEFSIRPEKMPGLTAIAKCNLHGMWRKQLPP